MTVYEFSRAYLEDQTSTYLPDFLIADLAFYDKPHIFSWPPYFTSTPSSVQKSDLMKMLAFILQNRFNLPNTINFEENYDALRSVTNNFDASHIASFSPEDFVDLLSRNIGFVLPSKSWSNYARGIVEAARYLNGIDPFNYASYLKKANSNPEALVQDLCCIHGMGPALARNFLKEIGVVGLGKPDVHLYAVFQAFDPTVTTPEDFDRSLVDQASKAGVSPFQMDRVIWLICSGNYFKHRIKIRKRNLRDAFVNSLKEAVENNTVTP
jgi:hypothetical protein